MILPVTTPGLLFPAISLMMLAHTNRFLALAQLIRSLHDKYKSDEVRQSVVAQIRNLRRRMKLIRATQFSGVLSFLLCAVCMFCVIKEWAAAADIMFAVSIACFIVSLILSLMEISLSLEALEIELADMEEYPSAAPGK
ncbi:DUF2721 domain-containing protein [Chitinophagaceae bacterium MMS25-I14]